LFLESDWMGSLSSLISKPFYTIMKPWNFSRLNPNFSKLSNWVNQISLEKLDIAYNAAVAIKEIETKHFNSSRISSDVNKGKIINNYFRVQLQRELANVKLNLAQFKLGERDL